MPRALTNELLRGLAGFEATAFAIRAVFAMTTVVWEVHRIAPRVLRAMSDVVCLRWANNRLVCTIYQFVYLFPRFMMHSGHRRTTTTSSSRSWMKRGE